jgi:acetyl esterase
VLVYPVVDPTAQLPSREEFATGHLIGSRDLDWFWEQYLRTPADAENPLAALAKGESLEGLPPTLVLTTEYEVARDKPRPTASNWPQPVSTPATPGSRGSSMACA